MIEELDDSERDSGDSDLLDLAEALELAKLRVTNSRYISTRKKRKSRKRWQSMLEGELFNDKEFHSCFRLSRNSFWVVHSRIKNHPIFNRRQRPSEAQLLVYLFYVGTREQNATKMSKFFEMGYGSIKNYIKRVICAIKYLRDEFIRWPLQEEREQISRRIFLDYGFPHCVGIIDGTLIFLETKPQWCGEDFNTRKGGYGVNSIVICDDKARILYYCIGWPGSTHDNRVWRNCKMCINKEDFFRPVEYLLSDSTMTPSDVLVPPFKRSAGNDHLPTNKEQFNTQLAKIRIRSEHCIGILKNRFRCLTNLNILIKKGSDMKKVIDVFDSCAVLHNILLEIGDIDNDWLTEEDDAEYARIFDEIGGYVEEHEGINEAIPEYENNTKRRDDVLISILIP